jgi:biopolymer transport protein ExbD
MQIRKTYRGEAEVFTEALNDILFILLMFFLIVATLANPNVIKLSQPKSQGDTKAASKFGFIEGRIVAHHFKRKDGTTNHCHQCGQDG